MAASVGADVVEIAADHGLFREQPARVAEAGLRSEIRFLTDDARDLIRAWP